MTNHNKSYWLWLEPYVHVWVKKNGVLLYNTMSGKKLEYDNRPGLAGFFRKFLSKRNLFITKINERQLNRPPLKGLIHDLKKEFMADMADASLSAVKPVQCPPVPNIQTDVRRAKDDPSIMGKNIMSYLSEMVFYINRSPAFQPLPPAFSGTDLHKQCHFPCIDARGPSRVLDLGLIEKVLAECRETGLYGLHINGGNILDYPQLRDLLALLEEFPAPATYHLPYLQAVDNADALHAMGGNQSQVSLWVTFPVQETAMQTICSRLPALPHVQLVFLIAAEAELAQCEDYIERFSISNYQLKPFYNGKNLDFLEDALFIDKEMLLDAQPTQQELIARMAVNENFFGKLVVRSSGDIHANINGPRLGNTKKNSIHEIVYKELYKGKSWLRSRARVLPCKNCRYQLLCPPISNYELAMGRNNLCRLYH